MEKHYAFIKDNRVVNVAVFSSQNDELANRIVAELNYDSAVWVAENKPVMWSSYNGIVFEEPTEEYLISIGILNPEPEVTE